MISATLEARGQGRLIVGNLHQRWTRFQFGRPIRRHLTWSSASEVNYTFIQEISSHPYPYFAGFRPAEGFEGYWMMRSIGTPFLLFSDPRLLGGAFLYGEWWVRTRCTDTIQHYLDCPRIWSRTNWFSGMSNGDLSFFVLWCWFWAMPLLLQNLTLLTNIGTIGNRARLLLFRKSFQQGVMSFIYGWWF